MQYQATSSGALTSFPWDCQIKNDNSQHDNSNLVWMNQNYIFYFFRSANNEVCYRKTIFFGSLMNFSNWFICAMRWKRVKIAGLNKDSHSAITDPDHLLKNRGRKVGKVGMCLCVCVCMYDVNFLILTFCNRKFQTHKSEENKVMTPMYSHRALAMTFDWFRYFFFLSRILCKWYCTEWIAVYLL